MGEADAAGAVARAREERRSCRAGARRGIRSHRDARRVRSRTPRARMPRAAHDPDRAGLAARRAAARRGRPVVRDRPRDPRGAGAAARASPRRSVAEQRASAPRRSRAASRRARPWPSTRRRSALDVDSAATAASGPLVVRGDEVLVRWSPPQRPTRSSPLDAYLRDRGRPARAPAAGGVSWQRAPAALLVGRRSSAGARRTLLLLGDRLDDRVLQPPLPGVQLLVGLAGAHDRAERRRIR